LMSETPGISILIVISLIIGDQNLSLFIAHWALRIMHTFSVVH
jgi:hypothetical protein